MIATLTIDGVDAEIHVTSGTIEERIGAPIAVRLGGVARSAGESVALGPLDPIGRDATLILKAHETERRYALLVDEVVEQHHHAELRLISPVGRLHDTCDHRVFVDMDATAVAAEVLGEHGIRLDLRARRAARRRPQWVQVFESDLAFCARILAEEGMSWTPRDEDGDTIVITDAPESFPDTGVSLPYLEEGGLAVDAAVHTARVRRRVATDKVTLRDYDFEHPMLDLVGESGDGALARYEFPGRFDDPAVGRELAEIRLAERRGDRAIIEAEATSPAIAAGTIVTVSGAPEGLDDRLLVLSVTHEIEGEEAGEIAYRARFRAVPASVGHRPPRVRPPARGGVGTGVVTGAPSEEISLDAHGRTRLLLRWDRRGTAGPKSSAYARVVQPQMSGSLMNPRVGWEEIFVHADGAGEIPLLLGRIYNAEQAPPASLPERRVETHFGTETTPGGGGGNFIQISDAAGQEGMSFNASGDYSEKIEKDKVALVAVNDVRDVGGKRKVVIDEHAIEAVGASFSTSVAALRKISVGSNHALKAASENIVVGAARLFNVGGDYTTTTPHYARLVGGAKQEIGIEHQSVFCVGTNTVAVGGALNVQAGPNESVGVAGAAVHKISGNHTFNAGTYDLKVRGIYAESFASRTATTSANIGESYGKITYDFGGAASYTGSAVVIEAKGRLTIKASGATIVMTPGSITVQAAYDGSTKSFEEGMHRYG